MLCIYQLDLRDNTQHVVRFHHSREIGYKSTKKIEQMIFEESKKIDQRY